jgi:hypothetical protein
MAQLPDAVPPDLDLLLITIDTLRADHLGCYGYSRPTSPVIDALGAEGAVFENGWAHAPSTRYSMPAIAAGRWPSAITWDESIWWPRLGPGRAHDRQALHAAGLLHGRLFSFNYFALGRHRGFERGMDEYHAERARCTSPVNGPMESRGSSSREITDDAIASSPRTATRSSSCGSLLRPAPVVRDASGGAAVRDVARRRLRRRDPVHRPAPGPADRAPARGRIVGSHRRSSSPAITAKGFGEHGITEHGFDLYPAQTKVPFIVRVPGLAPRRCARPVGHIDIAPTLLNLARGAASRRSSAARWSRRRRPPAPTPTRAPCSRR